MTSFPISKYRHYKGGVYEVIGLGKHTETGELMVIYKKEGDTTSFNFWVRPFAMFDEKVEHNGQTVKRFQFIGK